MPDGALVSFAMINRLVEDMLRSNPRVKRALRLTYPFVFLDQFQDTTYGQYSLVNAAFHDSNSVFTAVGDEKQKIMGWAGAMDNAFTNSPPTSMPFAMRFTGIGDHTTRLLPSSMSPHKKLIPTSKPGAS